MAEITNEVSSNDKNLAVLTHLGGILFSFIPSLIVWLLKKDSPFVSEQAREALNFQITLLIAYMVCYMLMFILIGFLLVAVVWLVNIVLCIVAATHASKGESYRYPLTLRLLN
jgi:uncharacterized Tic20 family protein